MNQDISAIFLWRVTSINLKGLCNSYTWSCSSCKGGLPFAWDLSLENVLQTQRGFNFFTTQLMAIVVLIGTVFMINLDMFHWRLYLSLMILLLLLNFKRGARLKLVYISLIANIRSSLIHIHGFQLVQQWIHKWD